jgi:hypothetical protein
MATNFGSGYFFCVELMLAGSWPLALCQDLNISLIHFTILTETQQRYNTIAGHLQLGRLRFAFGTLFPHYSHTDSETLVNTFHVVLQSTDRQTIYTVV